MFKIKKSDEFIYTTSFLRMTSAFVGAAIIGGIVVVVVAYISILYDLNVFNRVLHFKDLLRVFEFSSLIWLVFLVLYGGPIWTVLIVCGLRSYGYYIVMGAITLGLFRYSSYQPSHYTSNELLAQTSYNLLLSLSWAAYGGILGYIMFLSPKSDY